MSEDLRKVIKALAKYKVALVTFNDTTQEGIEAAEKMLADSHEKAILVKKKQSNILFIRNMLNEMYNTGDLNDRTPINLLDTVLEDIYG